jgi:hypothetical protein
MGKKKPSKKSAPKKSSSINKTRTAPEKFVEVWQTSNSADEVAKKLGLKLASVKAKAAVYRRKDIKLKKFPSTRGAKPLDVDKLSKLAAQFAPKGSMNGKSASA